MAKEKEPQKLIANNKKAYHEYFIEETYEAGISLHGTEVKSMRMGKGSIKESFIRIENGEVFVYGMHVSPYEKGNIFNKDPLRVKKLLLHKSEINKLAGKVAEKGYTLVPLQVYFKNGKVKTQVGLARGKKLYDKREAIAKKDRRREMERKELLQKNVEEFARLQGYMVLVEKESDAYRAMKGRYVELKVILTASGINLAELDIIKE